MLLGVDVGGTFTDAALAIDGRVLAAKAPTTPEDQSLGAMRAIAAALARAGRPATDVTAFAHGMTVATNALLEGRHARTALVATEGFTDVIELGRQARADLYRLCAAHPVPLVPSELRFGAPERIGPHGVLRALEPRAARALVERITAVEPEAVAVALLHAYRDPRHEDALGELLGERLPGVHVSLSHAVVGTFREYERTSTTVIDAALSPLVGRYLRGLAARAEEAGLPEPAVMQSSGGLADLGSAAAHAAWTVLSGPAGGATAAALTAARAGAADALCFDMGGTSCDVCVITGGAVATTAERSVAGRPLALPMVDVHTVGAGGGSIAWCDPGGALRVGPRSAGAEPGPACYGSGGAEPTVTDANLLLGYLAADAELAGGVRLDRRAAEQAVGRLGRELGLGLEECAAGIVRVANAEMVRALRVMTVERGIDPRGFALLAFGGAGPLHAAAIADELELDRILCPRAAGVLSAVGLAAGERRRDARRSVLRSGAGLTAAAIAADVDVLAGVARDALGAADAPLRCRYDLRYRGQAFELSIAGDPRPDPAALEAAFVEAHRERYGYADPAGEVELVTVQVTAALPGPALVLDAPVAGAPPGRARRPATFAGEVVATDVLHGEPRPGERLAGPLICELPEATLVVPPGWHGAVDRGGTIVLERRP